MKSFIVKALATGFYSGYSPVVAGTVGSIPPLLIAYFFIGESISVLWIVTIVTLIISIWAAGEAENLFGHDSKMIVSDEWAGMFITLLYVPHTPIAYLISFVWFRFFDVIKLWPAGKAEKLSGGWGVTMDDVVAGVQANLVTHLTLWTLLRLNWIS